MISLEYELCISHISRLMERRQNITTTYISVNAGITGAIAFLFKDGNIFDLQQKIAVIALLMSGIIASDIWRRLIIQYKILLGWWYERLRLVESSTQISYKLFSDEYNELYDPRNGSSHIGLSRYEVRLSWLFILSYTVFAVSILLSLVKFF